jgi:hypothetical protein
VADEPQYRVVTCRGTLARFRALPQADAILAKVDPAHILAIDEGRSLTWMSTKSMDAVADAAFEVLGTEAFREFFANSVNGWSDSKLFGPLIEAAERIFGADPAGHLKWLGRAWQITTRNMGTISTTETKTGVQVLYAGLPPSHRLERMIHSSYGSLVGIVSGRGRTPNVAIDDSRLAEGFLTFDVSW